MRQTVYLLDASIYIFRAYFALRGDWQARNGLPTHALIGYAGFLARLLADRPPCIVAAFDESLGSCFRHAIHPGYKARRALPDEALAFQLNACRELTRLLGITDLASPEFEADDLLASAAWHAHAAGLACTVLSRDKDLGQLLAHADDRLWDFPDGEPLDPAAWTAHHGIRPQQLPELLALTGDAIDDIPGVPGIGRRTAQALLAEYPDAESVLVAAPAIAASGLRGASRIAALLQQHQHTVRLARRLTGLREDALAHSPRFAREPVDAHALGEFAREHGLGERLTTRLQRAVEAAA